MQADTNLSLKAAGELCKLVPPPILLVLRWVNLVDLSSSFSDKFGLILWLWAQRSSLQPVVSREQEFDSFLYKNPLSDLSLNDKVKEACYGRWLYEYFMELTSFIKWLPFYQVCISVVHFFTHFQYPWTHFKHWALQRLTPCDISEP